MDSTVTLKHLVTREDWSCAFGVMKQLRPHLTDIAVFRVQMQHQHEEGYRLLAACDEHAVLGLAGYRTQTNLLYGRFVYVGDLVVDATLHRAGIGARLLDAVRHIARDASTSCSIPACIWRWRNASSTIAMGCSPKASLPPVASVLFIFQLVPTQNRESDMAVRNSYEL